jgi:transcriptional regulator with XRE-family HTH domain
MLNIEQVRSARMLLSWTQEDLAKRSGVALGTIKRLEAKAGLIGGNAETVWKIQAALEEAGVIFIPADAQHGYGVRLAKSSAT